MKLSGKSDNNLINNSMVTLLREAAVIVVNIIIMASLFILISQLFTIPAHGKKVKLHLNAKEDKKAQTEENFIGSFRDTENLSLISFTGYDKKINSSTESFFVKNNTDRTLTGIILTIEYLTPDGRQLEKKNHIIKCNIPPGETRKSDIKSWDTQHSFYYVKSAPTRSVGSPFIVKFDPTAIYLKY